MSIIGSELLLASAAATGYQVERSLRFNSSDSAYLSRTPASAGNRKTWTWAAWVKRCDVVNRSFIFGISDAGGTDFFKLEIGSDSSLSVSGGGTGGSCSITTQQVFRDCSAWYHLVVALDVTQATASNRVKIYVNGLQVTAFSAATYPSLNVDQGINSIQAHGIGRLGSLAFDYFNGYLADIHFIDGQALTPSSFAETNTTTGQWVPKAYSGSYGTNGFQLKFADNSSNTATTLGKDTSGNSNNWTPNNLSVTAGTGNDSLVDTPTSYGTDTGAGGEVRGNYCTLNSAAPGGSLGYIRDGSLNLVNPLYTQIPATFALRSGKWYWEIAPQSSNNNNHFVGIGPINNNLSTKIVGYDLANSVAIVYGTGAQSGFISIGGGSMSSSGVSITSGDIIGIAYDADAKKVWFSKNGTWVLSGNPAAGTNAVYSSLTGDDQGPILSIYDTSVYVNFGQRPFAYTAPSGFKALCDTNLLTPTIAKGNTVMDVKLYTGNGSTQTISGLGFSPDLVWLKSRSAVYNHFLVDAVRGVSAFLQSNNSNSEGSGSNFVTALGGDSFSVGNSPAINDPAATYAAWCFDAGSSTVSNTQGSITSQVRANASAGFSIVTYTGTGSAATVGHGLGVAPSMIIVKSRSNTWDWVVYHASVGNASVLALNTTAAAATYAAFANTTPTSTVFSLTGGAARNGVNVSAETHVAYCFAPVAGYSAFGTYTGIGGTNGPFIYTGHRAAFILFKRTDGTLTDWYIFDKSRLGYNAANYVLAPNNSDPEGTATVIDILSNGFKFRGSAAALNANGGTYIYAAFAENPFQYARAR